MNLGSKESALRLRRPTIAATRTGSGHAPNCRWHPCPRQHNMQATGACSSNGHPWSRSVLGHREHMDVCAIYETGASLLHFSSAAHLGKIVEIANAEISTEAAVKEAQHTDEAEPRRWKSIPARSNPSSAYAGSSQLMLRVVRETTASLGAKARTMAATYAGSR